MLLLDLRSRAQRWHEVSPTQNCQSEPYEALHCTQLRLNSLSTTERVHQTRQNYWLEHRLFL